MNKQLSYTDIVFIKTYSSVSENKKQNAWIRRFDYDVDCVLKLLDEPCVPSLINKNIKESGLNKLKQLYSECFNNSVYELTESNHKYIKRYAKNVLAGNITSDQEYRFILTPLYSNDVEFSKQKAISYLNQKINEKKYHGHNIQKISIELDDDFCDKWEEIVFIDKKWKERKYKQKQQEVLKKAELQLETYLFSKYLTSSETREICQEFETKKRLASINKTPYDFSFLDKIPEKINQNKQDMFKTLIHWIVENGKLLVVKNGFKFPVKLMRRGKKWIVLQGGLIY
jgi:hypothetical protein